MKNQKSVHADEDTVISNPFLPEVGVPMTEVMSRRASVFGRGISTLQHESMRFMTRRFEQNMKAIEQFGACKSLPDLIAAQQHWFSEMANAYTEELAKCGELMKELLSDGTGEEGKDPGPKRYHPQDRTADHDR